MGFRARPLGLGNPAPPAVWGKGVGGSGLPHPSLPLPPTVHLPHTLRCANITIIDHEQCEEAYPGNITDTMVCASVREEGKDSCQVRGEGPGTPTTSPSPTSLLSPTTSPASSTSSNT